MEIEQRPDYLASLKSIETENYIDRIFYRPLGFKIATRLQHTGITPNAITIISIFIGVAGALLFYFNNNLLLTLAGIVGLIVANILDCVDGQLARLTGIKSKIGRILDGMGGYFWFLTIYIALATHLYQHSQQGWVYGLVVLSCLSHSLQAAVTDYYKTLHLYFISSDAGKELDTVAAIRQRLQTATGITRLFTTLYLYYTIIQHKVTPQLQQMLQTLHSLYPTADIPQQQRVTFRRGSRMVMKIIDLLTFNGRSIPLFLILLTGHVWLYFLYEIVFLNIVLVVAINQHEALSRYFRLHLQSNNQTV